MTSHGMDLKTGVLVALICIANIAGSACLPKAAGFTNLPWTCACLLIYTFAFYVMSYTIRAGLPLSSLVPLISAVIPLATIAIGVIVFRDPVSYARLGMLCLPCVIVGGAMMV